MNKKYTEHIIHGADYNPDQWLRTPEIIEEDMRLMNLAHMNSATVGIFAWTMLEPEEGVFNFEWLDGIMDKLAANGKKIILATPSGARPAWLAQKYPEVLRVEESGIRNEYGVRHNHCLTSPIYREKVSIINRKLVKRYKDHPALLMWHISNEYCGECHCELCQEAFRNWLKDYYHNDLDELNFNWWNGFWSHQVTDWNQITSPKFRGENHVSALKLAWRRFVTDSHISFYENEVKAIRELCPDIPITTNMMRLARPIDYQKFAKHVDIISWDSYPNWAIDDSVEVAYTTAFVHDLFRSMKDGQPFFMMESTPSIANWKEDNKIPKSGMMELSSIQAVAHGADSVQYFQWRKSRGGHEKYHGAVVDHCGHENTRVFRDVTKLGRVLEKLDGVVGKRTNSRVAVIYDWENAWATDYFCGYSQNHRDYDLVCQNWYRTFWEKGIPVDVIAMDADYSKYDVVIAPFLYMLKDGTVERVEKYVADGGKFVTTYLSGVVDKNDLCYLGGFPAGKLKDVFGLWCEETDTLAEGDKNTVEFCGKNYDAVYNCDIIHSLGAEILGEYRSDFYSGMPAVTKNLYGKGEAYYVAFRNDGEFLTDFCQKLIVESSIESDIGIDLPYGVTARKRGNMIFIMNFNDSLVSVSLDKEYKNVLDGSLTKNAVIPSYGYLILE